MSIFFPSSCMYLFHVFSLWLAIIILHTRIFSCKILCLSKNECICINVLCSSIWTSHLVFAAVSKKKKTKNMRKKVFFSSRETSHFLFSRVFTITWRSFDSGMYVLSEQQPYILSYGRLKRFTGFELRKENCSIGSALVACVFVYCIFISLDVNLKIFVNFLRRRFHYFVWPLKIFKLKFTISCCWSSRLCISLSHHIRGEVGTFSILLKAFSIRVLFLSV